MGEYEDLSAEALMLKELSEGERLELSVNESISDMQRHLALIGDEIKLCEQQAKAFAMMAEYYVESDIDAAEQYAELAKNTNELRRRLFKYLRERRKETQWQTTRLKKLLSQSSEKSEPKPS